MASLNDVSGIVGGSRAQFINMLKIWYAKRWDDHVHTANEIMKLLGGKKGTMGGQFVKSVAVTGFPQSAGISMREGQGLPTARSTTQINPELISRDLYTLLSWTGQAERSAAAGDKAGWARPRQLDQELARKQMDINLCRKIFLGPFDVLGGVVSTSEDGGTSGGDRVTVYARNSRTSSGEAYWYAGNHYLRVNQSIGFAATPNGQPTYDMESTSTVALDEVYIDALGGTNAAPTFDTNVDMDSGGRLDPAVDDVIIPYKSRANTGNPPWTGTAADEISAFAGLNGIGNICTDDNVYAALYGLARSSSTNPTLRGVYQTNSGTTRPYEERLLTLLVHTIADEGTGTAPEKAILHNSTLREVIAEHDGNRRYAPVQTESGYGKLTYHIGDAKIPYITDWQCQPGMVVALEPGCWGWVEQSPMGPIDSSSERFVSGYDRHEVVWHKSGNFECTSPFSNGIIDDIDVDVYAINS